MTKNFAQAPKPRPSPEAIAAFERGGSGQDRRTHIPSNAGTGEPTEVGPPEREPQTHISSNAGKRETTEVGQSNAHQDNTQTHISTKAGTGEPTEVVEGKLTEAGRQERTRRLSVDLPESWHRRFKTACSKTDRKMLAEVTAFIKNRTIELENE
jgi:hypothetical protein